MIRFTDMSGLFSTILLMAGVFSLVFPVTRFSRPDRWLVLSIFVCLTLIPFGPVSAAWYVRSFIGDLSISSVIVLLLTLIDRVFGLTWVERRAVDSFCLGFLPVAVVFYPLALGFGRYDPYALGFGSLYLLGFIFLITLLAWAKDRSLTAVVLSLAVFGYAAGWYESNNLWDYLIDPLLATYALIVAIKRGFRATHFGFRRIMEKPGR